MSTYLTAPVPTKKLPGGIPYIIGNEAAERFSFYGMRALLTLYMVNEIFEALANRDIAAAAVYASYGSLVYASTVVGGRISDLYLGYRKSIFLGGADNKKRCL